VTLAIELLRPLASFAEDPDYAAALADILSEAGRTQEAQTWQQDAATRYESLLARHPDGFADHMAAFLLDQGGDTRRALELAQRNFALRDTPRSRRLLDRAERASGDATPDAGTPR